jgi:glycosyltransferase involved in cell wall biosynthesis
MNNTLKPSITIGIASYNQAHFLSECIQSLIKSKYTNWEAIVVDDASTVGDVAEVLARYNDPRIRVIRHHINRGLAAARNTAFNEGNGNLILSLDADDCLAPQFLSKTIDILENDSEVDCVFTDFLLFGNETGIMHQSVYETKELLRRQTIPGAGTLMRRKLWEQAGGYCEDPILRMGNEDWDFWLACSYDKLITRNIPESLYLYRRTPGSLSDSLRYNDFITREFIYRRHKTLFDKYNEGSIFLSEGCIRTALAAKGRHEWLYTFRMTAKACHYSDKPAVMIMLMLKGFTFPWILKINLYGKRMTQRIVKKTLH